MASAENALPSIIGAAVPRIDGPLKVSGNAMYTADFHFPGMVYAVPVCSTVAKGKLRDLTPRMPRRCQAFWQSCIARILADYTGLREI